MGYNYSIVSSPNWPISTILQNDILMNYLATSADARIILRQTVLHEWFKDHFSEFVGFAVLMKIHYEGHEFEKRHLDRAVMLGSALATSYKAWNRHCIEKGITDDVKESVSNAIARLLVGNEEEFVQKIYSELNNININMGNIRVSIKENLVKKDCIGMKNFKKNLSQHYELGWS